MTRWTHHNSASTVMAALLLLAGSTAAGAQPAFLVRDINTTVTGGTDAPLFSAGFVELNGVVYVNLVDGIHGGELWRTDGTAAGTWLVKDICPGVCSGAHFGMLAVGAELYFRADDGAHGAELWKSDGTAAGTEMVVDLRPGLAESNPEPLADLGGVLIFSAITADAGRELWRSDGTAAGTWLVKDIEPGPTGSLPRAAAVIGGKLFFQASDSIAGNELWTTDGTAAGTARVKDINPGAGHGGFQDSQYPGYRGFAVLAGKLYFGATQPVHGTELWVSDGTEAGTALVKDIEPGPGSSYPFGFLVRGDEVLFRASESASGSELWKTDGTEAGTVKVKEIAPGLEWSYPSDLTLFRGDVYLIATDIVHGQELWRTDGTEAGTVMVKDIFPGPQSSLVLYRVTSFMNLGSWLVFFADDGVHGPELWRTDGTESGTMMVGDLYPGPFGSYVAALENLDSPLALNGTAIFRAWVPDSGAELWRSDGTPEGTVQIEDINAQTSAFEVNAFIGDLIGAHALADLDGVLLFQGGDGTTGAELWSSDGTEPGTLPVKDIWPGVYGALPHEITSLGDKAVFVAEEEPFGRELWVSDGTEVGTALLEDLCPGPESSYPRELTRIGDEILYFAGGGLRRTDGTANGGWACGDSSGNALTVLSDGSVYFVAAGIDGFELVGPAGSVVKDIFPGPDSSFPNRLVALGDLLLFSAQEPASGRELWRSDGTQAGTGLVRDIRPGADSSIVFRYPDLVFGTGVGLIAAAGGAAFLPADDGIAGEELWRSDGSEAGTTLVKDIRPGADPSEILWLTALGDRVVFVADDGVHGRELWSSDGTEAGTFLLLDVRPGPGSSLPEQLAAIGGWLFFSADDGVHGREPWVTDGTLVGTRLLQDIAPGVGPSSPLRFTASGPYVYFAANDNVHGFELWALPIAALGPPAPSDTVPPTVIRMRAVPVGGGSYRAILVTFSEPVYDPPGDDGRYDVTNPANYLLVEAGTDEAIETVSCAEGVAGDDVQVPLGAITYDAATRIATVELAPPIGYGRYALFVCGTTTIRDLAGNPLAGGADVRFLLQLNSILEIPTLSGAGALLFVLLLAAAGWALHRR